MAVGQGGGNITRPRGGGIVSVGGFLIVPLFPAVSAISEGIKEPNVYILHSVKKSPSDSTNRSI